MWLYLTIFAYLLFALANVGDKLVVSKYKTEPIVYVFYVGFLGIISLWLVPFGVTFIEGRFLLEAFFAGVLFMAALYCMYRALSRGETTSAITVLGGSSPIFTFLLSNIFLGEILQVNEIAAFVFLLLAIVLIQRQNKDNANGNNNQMLIWAILSGFAFACNYVLTKHLFNHETFFNVFFWTRIGGFLTALVIILLPEARRKIKADYRRPKKEKGFLLLSIQAAGGLGVIGQNYSLSLASATIINALQAIQYAFVFILTALLGKKYSQLREKLEPSQIFQKIFAFFLIAIGLILLSI